MSGWSKQKRGNAYVDRSQVLKDSNRQPNVSRAVVAIPCIDKEKTGSLERHFKHMLCSSKDDATMLTAMVMHNDICVLVLKKNTKNVASIVFKVKVDSDSISGKKKKGAKMLKAGSSILQINFSDGSTGEYFSPIGGQLLEINNILLSSPNLLFDQPCGTGFIAVIYPDTEIPNLNNNLSGKFSIEQPSIEEIKSNICFAFKKGLCSRGDKCKFKHNEIIISELDLELGSDESESKRRKLVEDSSESLTSTPCTTLNLTDGEMLTVVEPGTV